MSKTCGECRFYFEQAEFCRKNAWECIEEDKECCDEFEKPTNGDKIRQMSNEKFTQGEWKVERWNEVNTEQKNICRCIRLAMEPAETAANAALIASSPEMYRVLSGICLEKSAQICKFAPESCKVCQIRKALKKARGVGMSILKDIQKELAEFQNKAFAECHAEQMIAENIYNIAVYSHCCQVIEVIKERLLDKLFFSLPAEKQREMLNEIISEIKQNITKTKGENNNVLHLQF